MNRFYTTIGYDCNQNCINCILDKEIRDRKFKLDLQRFKEIMSKYEISEDDIFEVTGGETTLDQFLLLDVLNYAKNRGFKRNRVNVLTNAINFTSDELINKATPLFGHVVSTFYSHKPYIHDKISGTKKSFEKKIIALKKLEQKNVILHIKTLISRFNYKDLDKFIDFCNKEFPKSYILLTWIDYKGEAWKNRDHLIVTLEETVSHIQKAIEKARTYNLKYSLLFPLCMIDPYYWKGIIPRAITDNLEKAIFIDPLEDNSFREFPGKKIRFVDKPSVCNGCIFSEKCVWEWKNYTQLYELKKLAPITL